MTLTSRHSKVLSVVLIVLGLVLQILSCFREILRGGNEPIAGMIAVVGLFAIAGGALGCRRMGQRMSELQRVRLALFFEHLLYGVGLGTWWLIVERESFFIDTPFGRDILPLQRLLLAVLVGIAVICAALRTALRTGLPLRQRRARLPVSGPAWGTTGVAVAVVAVLNLLQGQATVRASDGLEVSVFSRGFPLPVVQRIEVHPPPHRVSAGDQPLVDTLTLDDGTEIRSEQDGITVVRHGRLPKRLPHTAGGIALSDGTRVGFQDGQIIVSLRGRAPVTIEPRIGRATFSGGVTCRSDARAIAVNILIGLLLAVHCGVCAERLHRGFERLNPKRLHEART